MVHIQWNTLFQSDRNWKVSRFQGYLALLTSGVLQLTVEIYYVCGVFSLRDSQLMGSGQFSRKVTVYRGSGSDEVRVHYISMEYGETCGGCVGVSYCVCVYVLQLGWMSRRYSLLATLVLHQ